MAMPPQLARAKRRHDRNSERRALVELTPCVDIHDLCRWKVFPDDYYSQHKLEMTFRYPWAKSLAISRRNIEFNHVSGYNQVVGIHWCRTGMGKQRPIFICGQCCGGARRLFLKHGSLKCRFCHGLRYASEKRDNITRKRLTASKLRLKLGGWPNITEPLPPKPKLTRRKTYQRITKQIQALEAQASKRPDTKP